MKKFLLSLFLSFVGFISFCSAGQVVDLLDLTTVTDISTEAYQRTTIVNFGNTNNSYTVCFSFDNFRGNIQAGIGSNPNSQPGTNFTYWNDWNGNYVCFYKSSVDNYLNVRTDYSDSITLNYFILNDLLVYNIDTNYCVSNNLCPISESSLSSLYINNIEHQSAPLINIDIPDYIHWDYTSSEEEFDLYVGSGYDQEYIDSVISVQSYQPTSQDFTDVFVGGLTLIFPYIVIVLFIVFVRKLLKRIFK